MGAVTYDIFPQDGVHYRNEEEVVAYKDRWIEVTRAFYNSSYKFYPELQKILFIDNQTLKFVFNRNLNISDWNETGGVKALGFGFTDGENSYNDSHVSTTTLNGTNVTVELSENITRDVLVSYGLGTSAQGEVSLRDNETEFPVLMMFEEEVYDDVAPSIVLVSPSASYSETSSSATINFQFNVSDEKNDVFYCSVFLDNVEYANTSVISETETNNISISLISTGSHSWKVFCNDSLGNEGNSSSRSFTITAPATTTSQSGGSPSFHPTQSNLQEGYSKSMGRNWKLKFDVKNESHELKLDNFDLDTKTATVSVFSELQIKVLSVGEEWKVDVDGDNFYDLLIRLDNVTLFRANIFVMEIDEEIFVDVISGNVVEGDDNEVVEDEIGYFWVWVIIILFVVTFLIGFKVFGKKKLKKN